MQTINKVLAICFFTMTAIVPSRIFAIAQAVEPIVIDNALRGQEYERFLSLTNTDNEPADFEVVANGDIFDFTSFYETNAPDKELPKLLLHIPGNGTVTAVVKFTISSDLKSDQTYKGYINFSYAPSSDSAEKNQNSVIAGVGRPVSITLGGKEIIEATCNFMPVNAFTEVGTPLKIMTTCTNNGNVNIKPSVQVSVSQNGQVVSGSSMVFLYDSNKKGIKPAQSEVLDYELQTGNLNLGDYQIDVKVFQGEKEFQHNIYDVKILEKNTLNKLGVASLAATSVNYQQWLTIAIAVVLIIAIIVFVIIKKRSSGKTSSTITQELN